ncbi:MAG TPA: hypothetical protein VHW09_10305 [Bryobacteraceae bacterium]|jgi:O-antigen/teichoic acid export membrane protein|nr:hypothetical protein [Bryobacteraceae bacterium]
MKRSLIALSQRWPSLLALCDQGVVSATNFTTGVIIGRVCGKTELGIYALAWTLITFTTEISAALITTPYTVSIPHLTAERRGHYLQSMLAHQTILSVLTGILVGAVALFARATHAATFGPLVRLLPTVAVAIVCITLREFVRRVSFAELRLPTVLILDAAICVAQIGGLLALTFTHLLTAGHAYFVLAAASGTAVLVWLAVRGVRLRFSPAVWKQDFVESWGLAKWLLSSGLLWAVAMYLYPWFITAFQGAAATGAWAACYAVVAVGNPALLGLGNYIGPKIATVYAERGSREMRAYVRRCSLAFAGALLPLGIGLLVAGDKVLVRMYGKLYAGNGTVVTLLGFNLVLTALFYPYSRGLFALRRPKADTVANLAAITILFTVGIEAVKTYGDVGAAAALLLTTAATGLLRVRALRQESARLAPPAPNVEAAEMAQA